MLPSTPRFSAMPSTRLASISLALASSSARCWAYSAALLHLLNEILLDLALGVLRLAAERDQLSVVPLPAIGLKQSLGLLELAALRQGTDVGDGRPDLAGGADLRGAGAGLCREDRVEVGIKREEHRGGDGGEKHHPQHGVLEHQPQALRIGAGDLAT